MHSLLLPQARRSQRSPSLLDSFIPDGPFSEHFRTFPPSRPPSHPTPSQPPSHPTRLLPFQRLRSRMPSKVPPRTRLVSTRRIRIYTFRQARSTSVSIHHTRKLRHAAHSVFLPTASRPRSTMHLRRKTMRIYSQSLKMKRKSTSAMPLW